MDLQYNRCFTKIYRWISDEININSIIKSSCTYFTICLQVAVSSLVDIECRHLYFMTSFFYQWTSCKILSMVEPWLSWPGSKCNYFYFCSEHFCLYICVFILPRAFDRWRILDVLIPLCTRCSCLLQWYRVTHKGWDFNNDIKLFRYNDLKVDFRFLPSMQSLKKTRFRQSSLKSHILG